MHTLMTTAFTKWWPVLLSALGLAVIVALNIAPYGGNVSVLFHLDEPIHERQPVPENFVVLTVPAYDGAHYYQIARNIPLLFSAEGRATLGSQPTFSYAYQRFLLPASAYILAVGQEGLLPYTFLFINLTAILLAAAIVWRATNKPLYALAIAFCPSAMVALHFSLAEPLTLLILAAVLTRFSAYGERLRWLDVVLLSLLPLSREVNILFIAFFTAYLLLRKNWRDAALMLFPVMSFLALHGLIYQIFGEIPFLTSADKRTFPFQAVFELLTGVYGYNRLTVTSIPLFLFFTLPALIWTGYLIIKNKNRSALALGSLAFLLLMGMMPDHIWGSITSIGRVITPVYPLVILLCARHDTLPARFIAGMAGIIGIGGGLALAFVHHPFILA